MKVSELKKRKICLSFLLGAILLTGCSNAQLESAKVAIDEYNTQIVVYNESVQSFNDTIEEIQIKNSELQSALDEAQEVINKGESPFDEKTLENLKEVMADATEMKVDIPDKFPVFEELSVDEKAKKSELKNLEDQAIADTNEMKSVKVPELPEIPDYSSKIKDISDAKLIYEDSIQGLKQITAPTDEFVLERLQGVDTISEMDAVSEDNDPNGQLNKQGGYIGCIYFRDTQVDWSELYVEAGKDNVIDVGCEGGGAIEIFNTVEEAEVRNTYLASFDGTGFASGSHYVYGTILIRTSNELSGTKQLELTDKIVNSLIRVDH